MSHIFSGIYFADHATETDLKNLIDQAIKENAQALLVIIASQAEIEITAIPPMASQCPVTIYSCVVPGIIYQYSHSFDGVLIIGFVENVQATFIKNMSVEQHEIEQALSEFTELNGNHGSALVLLDGLSKEVEPFISTLYEQLGSERMIIGAGAGYSDFQNRPCIAGASGCFSNSAIIISISNRVKINSLGKHGWHDIAGPFLLTEAEGNIIRSLNYQPAFKVYKEAIAQFNGTEITAENFSQEAHSYPLGLKQLESEHLIRDTIMLDGESLVCVGKVAQNSLVYIHHASRQQLIDSASEAAREIKPKLNKTPANKNPYILTIDCISRALFLQEDYPKELDALKNTLPNDTIAVGLLSIGEIINTPQGAIQFLNKTLVLGGF